MSDGRLLAFGRHADIDGRMPKSISDDMGETWTCSATPFPPITMTQRLVLIRLKEGPLFFASFAGRNAFVLRNGEERVKDNGESLVVVDAAGRERRVNGMFGALSFDEGETWPVRKLLTPGGPPTVLGLFGGSCFTLDATTAEPMGYLSACQAPDGVIHLITSQRHYAFNLAWLKAPM